MNDLESIRAWSIGSPSLPDFKPYVYGGDVPLSAEKQPYRKPPKECSVDDCTRITRAGGMCESHYRANLSLIRKGPPPKKRHGQFNPDACGTPRGYERHKYWGLEACVPCSVAHTEYRHALKARAKAKKEAGK